MKKILSPVSFLCTAAAAVAWAAEPAAEPAAFTVAPVRAVCSAPLPAGLPPTLKNAALGSAFMLPAGENEKTRYEIFLLVSGAGLIGIQPATLQVDGAKNPEGENIARDYRGLSTTTAGMQAPVSEDGKFGVFSIVINTDEPAPQMPLDIKGSIRVKTSGKAETAAHTAQLEDTGEPVNLGPFEVAVSVQRQVLRVKVTGSLELFAGLEAESGGQKLGASTSNIQFFSGGGINAGNANISNISISLNTTAVNADGGAATVSFDQGAMQEMVKNAMFPAAQGGEESRTFSFPLPKDAAEARISLTYWTDPKEQELPFEAVVFERAAQ